MLSRAVGLSLFPFAEDLSFLSHPYSGVFLSLGFCSVILVLPDRFYIYLYFLGPELTGVYAFTHSEKFTPLLSLIFLLLHSLLPFWKI